MLNASFKLAVIEAHGPRQDPISVQKSPGLFFVALLILMSGFFTFLAFSLCQYAERNCQMAMSSCSVGIDLMAGFVSLVIL